MAKHEELIMQKIMNWSVCWTKLADVKSNPCVAGSSPAGGAMRNKWLYRDINTEIKKETSTVAKYKHEVLLDVIKTSNIGAYLSW